jgi:hypothetical protein
MRSEYLTPGKVAKRYRIAEGTLANWRSAGRGPRFFKLGGRVYYAAWALDEWEQRLARGRRV